MKKIVKFYRDQIAKLPSSVQDALPLIYLIIALFALRYSLIEPYVVPTPSMEPTLKKGDRLYANKAAYDLRFPFTNWVLWRFKPVKRGDVILFVAPREPDKIYVKRAVGIEGDRIEVRNGAVVVNGEEHVLEPYNQRQIMYDIDEEASKSLLTETMGGVRHHVILHNYDPRYRTIPLHEGTFQTDDGIVTVPPGHIFAMGDNRDQSYDSRGWGFVPIENLKGQAMFIWYSSWSEGPFFSLESFRTWHIRTERIGTLIR